MPAAGIKPHADAHAGKPAAHAGPAASGTKPAAEPLKGSHADASKGSDGVQRTGAFQQLFH